jgi:integrase
MPFKFELTWIPKARRWRKRYLGRTYYLKTDVGGKTDREGYLAAMAEWQRLKAHIDGLGPNPYTSTGVLIPAGTESPAQTPIVGVASPELAFAPDDPPWILSRGIAAALHPQLIVKPNLPHAQTDERRVSTLATGYLNHRRQEAERGDLSLKQYDDDRRHVELFRDFLSVNYPTLAFIDQVSADVLNQYRDKQTELCGSNVTLKKRLEGVRKWLAWLVDRNILRELPKDLSSYAKVRLKRPKPAFFTVEEIKSIYNQSGDLLKACVLLGLNAGLTQKDCATLTPEMIDFESGILSRDRNKTGCDQRAKLWPETLAAIRKVGRFDPGKPVLLTATGKPLVSESVKPTGKVVKIDYVRKLWDRLDLPCTGKSFKHLRKTSADFVERHNPALTSLFLAHVEPGVRKHYVNQHGYQQLFKLTDKLRLHYKLF